MSLFVCSKCGCIDNTATSYYWALIRPCKNRIYDKSLKGYEGKPLCSECAAIEYSKGGEMVVVPGTWHVDILPSLKRMGFLDTNARNPDITIAGITLALQFGNALPKYITGCKNITVVNCAARRAYPRAVA